VSLSQVRRYASFPEGGRGGNPAGVVLGAGALSEAEMLAIAAEVGYSETAFVLSQESEPRRARLRYFSPGAEVPFCGHATIATAVALAELEGPGAILFETAVGPITLQTREEAGQITAAFTSAPPAVRPLAEAVLERLLGLLKLTPADLEYAPRESFAGNWHPVLVVREAERFDAFGFEPEAVRALMDEQNWTGTVTVLHRLASGEFEARNLFPVGDITEDPATGSAAASTGAYLRDLGLVSPPERIVIHQGRHVGRPSLLLVDIPAEGGIVVSGTAIQIQP
jgi:PhzF family phenazine biosynthesis protein